MLLDSYRIHLAFCVYSFACYAVLWFVVCDCLVFMLLLLFELLLLCVCVVWLTFVFVLFGMS